MSDNKYLNRDAWRDRRKATTKIKDNNFFVHETSIVDDNVYIGDGTKIWHFSHIISGTKIGTNCSFGQNCVVGGDVNIGNGVKVQNNVSIYKGVEIEDDVFLGPSMVFTNVINPRAFITRKDEFKKTLLKKRLLNWCKCHNYLWCEHWRVCFDWKWSSNQS